MAKTDAGIASWADSDLSAVVWSRRKIRTILERHHVGRDTAISAQRLAVSVPVSASTVRDIMQQLRADGLPVGSKGPGYYIVATRDELRYEVGKRYEEIATRKRTIRQLSEAFDG